MKHLSKTLSTTGIEDLIEFNDEKSIDTAKKRKNISDAVESALCKDNIKDVHKSYLAVAEGLFESGFISTNESCFNTEKLFNSIYAIKITEAIDDMISLHQKLTDLGADDHIGVQEPSRLYNIQNENKDIIGHKCFSCFSEYPLEYNKEQGCSQCHSTYNKKRYNSSGDNYYSAYTIERELSKATKHVASMSIKKGRRTEMPNKPISRVIIAENQSPMYAVVLDYSTFTPEQIDNIHFVRLKKKYNDKNRVEEFLKIIQEGTLENNHKWSLNNDSINYGLLTTVNVREKDCNFLEHKSLEMVLFNIKSGLVCIEEDLKQSEHLEIC